ncbi:MAG: protein-disulfide reductase DsbD domain-containing protein [Phycisphaerales bacterium JB039]
MRGFTPAAPAGRFGLAALVLTLFALVRPAAAQPDPVAVSAQASAGQVAPGGRLVIAVILDHEPHYHTWPSAAQDVLPAEIAEFAIRTEIGLAETPGWIDAVGPVQWPTPSPAPVPNLVTGEGTMEVPTYQGRAVAYLPILIADSAPAGDVSLNVKVGYQACDDAMCYMPEEKTVVVRTAVAPGAAAADLTGIFEGFDSAVFAEMSQPGAPLAPAQPPAPAFDPDDPVNVSAIAWSDEVAPGSQTVVAVILDHAEHMHTWPAAAQNALPPDLASFAINTDIALADPPAWLALAQPIQWPEPSKAPVPSPTGDGAVDAPVFQGRAVAFVALTIAPDAPAGAAELRLTVSYQACDDAMCFAPEQKTVAVPVSITPGAVPAIEPDPIFGAWEGFTGAGVDQGPGDRAASDPESAAEPEGPARVAPAFFGLRLPSPETPLGMAVVLLASVAGGFVLNLTPCVLPVIPIKVMTLSQHGGDRRHTLILGAWMAAGVVAFWVGIGIPAALVAGFTDPSQIFGIWWLTFGIGVLIALMALGLFGAFSLNLPKAVYAVNPKADTPSGSFVYGVMTGVLGLPCFGFVAGALLSGAALLPPLLVIAIFGAIGAGMALPYFVLAMKPALIEKIPRTGPASELVKQVMGLLLFAAAAYFIGSGLIGLVAEQPWMGKMLHWWAVAIFSILAGLWLLLRTFQITSKPIPRVSFAILAVLTGGIATLYAVSSTSSARDIYEKRQLALDAPAGQGALVTSTWIPYDPALFDRARQEGYIVVLDFTAEWCIICKSLKAAVLSREPVKAALASDRVVSMTVDLTSRSAPGWKTLQALGQTGIPTLAIYTPGQDTPWIANNYTRQQVVEALQRAGAEVGTADAGPAGARQVAGGP